MTFRISLEKPEHGWVPVRVEIGAEVFEFDGSDVPNNSIQELVDALSKSARGLEATVWWHLEPDGYYFKLEPSARGMQFHLQFANGSKESTKTLCASAEGSREEILLPIWRSLRRFQSLGATEPHWPPVEFKALEGLKVLLAREDS
jgi:hypothetical protein